MSTAAADVYHAARGNEVIRLKLLVSEGAPLDYRDGSGFCALHLAAQDNHVECLQLLLSAGADREAVNKDGWTPLIEASGEGCLECTTTLLQAGAKIDTRDLIGRNALHWAARLGKLRCLRALLDAGADMEARDNIGWTPLFHAATMGREDIINELLKRGADWSARDNEGWSALKAAATSTAIDTEYRCIRALLAAGACAAEVSSKDGTGIAERILVKLSMNNAPRVAVINEAGCSDEGKKVRAAPHFVMGCLEAQYMSGDSPHLDVTLEAEGESIRVHGAVLAAHGPFWDSLITGGMARPDRTYALTDISAAQLRVVTDFCYSGRLSHALAHAHLVNTLRLAHRYQMQHLIDTLIARLARTLCLDDEVILETYAVALELDVQPLLDRVAELTSAPEAHEWWTALVSDNEQWSRMCQEATAGNALMRAFICNVLRPRGGGVDGAAFPKKRKASGQ